MAANSTPQFASPHGGLNFTPTYHAPKLTKAKSTPGFVSTKGPGGTLTVPTKATLNRKPNPSSEADAGSMKGYNPNLK